MIKNDNNQKKYIFLSLYLHLGVSKENCVHIQWKTGWANSWLRVKYLTRKSLCNTLFCLIFVLEKVLPPILVYLGTSDYNGVSAGFSETWGNYRAGVSGFAGALQSSRSSGAGLIEASAWDFSCRCQLNTDNRSKPFVCSYPEQTLPAQNGLLS